MGSQETPDFTLAGQGVVLASRFETSCDPFKILMGEETNTILSIIVSENIGIKEKWIQIKHSNELVRTYELNPFYNRAEELKTARMKFYQQIRANMQHPRETTANDSLKLRVDDITCDILNYSLKGFGIVGDTFWGRNVVLTASLHSEDPDVQRAISINHLDSFKIAIKWGLLLEGDMYRHGVSLISLNDSQLVILNQLCNRVLADTQSA